MLRSSAALRHATQLAVLVSCAWSASACSSDTSSGDGAQADTGVGDDAADARAVGDTATAGDSGARTDTRPSGDTGPRADSGSTLDAADAPEPIGPAPVLLGGAGRFVILAKAAVKNVPTSIITGDVGLSPAAASYITGFALTKAGTYFTDPQVVGSIFASDNDPPTPTDLTTAVSDMETAYTDAAGRPTPAYVDLGSGGAIGGLTLKPGLYNWTTAVTIPSDITLAGAAGDTWIFQIPGDLTMSSATAMKLSGGALAKNVVWQVAGAVTLGTTSHSAGVILCQTAITLQTGASIEGRLLAQTAVNVDGVTITAPAP